jgi:hypothetical protein
MNRRRLVSVVRSMLELREKPKGQKSQLALILPSLDFRMDGVFALREDGHKNAIYCGDIGRIRLNSPKYPSRCRAKTR